MKSRLSQPVLFNLITIVAMLFSLFQLVTVSQRTATNEVIELFEELGEKGDIEDETLSLRLAAEQDERLRLIASAADGWESQWDEACGKELADKIRALFKKYEG